jgi:hypothetical protein
MLGEIFCYAFFFSLFFGTKEILMIISNTKKVKSKKPKRKVIYRPRFSCGIDHRWTLDYVAAGVAIGDDMVMLLTWRPMA